MNKDKRNNIQLLGTLNNSDESGIIANANQVYDANEDKSTQDVSKEHKERIETLETKESSMQTTLENITKTGEASAASNVTYNHNDSKLDATNVQQAVDEVRKRSNYNDGDSIIDFNTIHLVEDNPEFVAVWIDANNRIFYGFQNDGEPYWGVGVPKVVRDYVDAKIYKILGVSDITEAIDSLKEIEAFVADFKNSDTLKNLLDAKANAIDVKATTDDIYRRSNYNDGENIIDFNTIHLITDNPEFIMAAVDADDRMLYGIKSDGEPYWGVGVPKVVRDYVDKQVNDILGTNNITETIDSLKEVEKFLSDFKNSDTLKNLLDTKANKTDVDSTITNINANIADKYKKSNPNDKEGNVVDTNTIISFEDNPEYIKAIIDNVGKLIEAIGLDGVRKFFAGINVQGTLQCVTDNPEYIAVWLDNQNKIVFGFKSNGDPYFGYGIPSQINTVIEALKSNTESLTSEIKKTLSNKVDKEEGKSLIDEGFAASQSVIEDPESRHEIMLDSEEKIISYRKEDGTKVENIGIETPNVTAKNISAKEVNIEGGEATLEKATLNSLELTNEGMTEFQRALKDSGFRPGGAGDWSDYISGDGDNPLCIPEPRCAMINITNSSGNFVWPTSKPGQSDYQKGINADKEAIFEFWDMQGNYFKKTINISAQGRSSMVYPKKNAGFDLFDSEYDGDAFSVRFGNWPAMNSYHLKAYYTDFFRGAAIVAYKFAMEVDGTYPVNKDKNWKKALLDKYDFGTCTADGKQLSDLSLQVDTGALCMPDGFPCIVYANGAFYGVYSFNIKKARDNYHMKKSNPKHIHLDGTLNGDTIFINPNNPSHNTINWGTFEIRNPKNLVYATAQSYTEDGETKTTYKYDADIRQAEIAGNADGSDAYSAWQAGSYPADVIVGHNGHYFINTVEGNDKEPVYDKSKNADDSPDFKNKTKCGWLNCTNTIKVKNSIIQFSKYWKAIQDKNGAEARREELEKYFDSKNLIDYYIIQLVTGDSDGFGSNWQWTTWDGEHWYVNEYDKDMVFGANFTGAFTMPPFMSWVNTDYRFSIFSNTNSSYNGVMPYIYNYYKTEIKDRYKELRDKGIITVDNIINKLVDWINRIGVLNLEKEYAKWSYSPCNMLPILNDGWEFYKYESFAEYSSIANYDSSITYNAGDKCKYGYTCFIATKSISGVVPAQRISHCDNIYRIENWIKERIALEDSYLEYNV